MNAIRTAYESKIRAALSCDIAEYFIANHMDDLVDDELVDVFGEIGDFDPRSYNLACDRDGRHETSLGDASIIDGELLCRRCADRLRAADEFKALTESVEAVFERCGWTVAHTSFAATGTYYYTIEKEVDDEVKVLKIRVADHGECYCREDYSVDPEGLTVEALEEILSE